MKLHIDRAALLAHLTNVNAVVSKDSQDAARCVLLSAADGRLELIGTDTLHSYSASVEAKVDRPGTVAIPADKLYQTVKLQSEHAITITWDEGKASAEVRAGSSKSRIAVLPADQFPELPAFDPEATAVLLEGDLQRLMVQVRPFVDPNDARYGLNGAHLSQVGDRIRVQGCDGSKLGRAEAPFEGEIRMPPASLVSRKSMDLLTKLLDKPEQHVELAFSDSAMQVERGDQTLWFRLVKGEFPDVEGILPTQATATASVPKAMFMAALNRVLVCNRDSGLATEIRVHAEGIYLRGWNRSAGEAEEEVACETTGELLLGMEAELLLDSLRPVISETLRFSFAGPLAFVVVRDDNAVFVIGPRRLDP